MADGGCPASAHRFGHAAKQKRRRELAYIGKFCRPRLQLGSVFRV